MLRRYNHTVLSNLDGTRSFQVRANIGSGVGGTSAVTATAIGKPTQVGILDGLVDTRNDVMLRQLCRDIYYHDPVCGSIVDLFSNMPFGDFTLSSVPDLDILKVYLKCCERMRIKSFLPSLCVDERVDGAFLGILNFNRGDKIFDSILPQNLDFAELTTIPIYGHQPLIDLKFPAELRKLFTSEDPRLRKVVNQFPQVVRDGIMKGKIALNPENTLYIPRKTLSTKHTGTSYFQRVIPLWLLEKALMRGGIELAHRRQRGILHLTGGDEDWEPTNEELSTLANSFMSADMDPVGAVVATRQGVQITEVQPGGEFWKPEDIADWVVHMKLRALGLSDAFIGADATYANAEGALNVFIQQLKAYRDYITRVVFYEKIFPYLAITNRFRKDVTHSTYGSAEGGPRMAVASMETMARELAKERGSRIFQNGENDYYAVCDGSGWVDQMSELDIDEYYIPTVTWHNDLNPQADAAMFERLQALSQMNIPIPIRAIYALVGVPVNEVVHGMKEDVELRKKLSTYLKQIKPLDVGIMPPEEGMQDPMQMMAQDFKPQDYAANAALAHLLDMAEGKPKPHRVFDPDLYGPRNVTKGKAHPYTKKGADYQNEKDNKVVMEAISRIGERRKKGSNGFTRSFMPPLKPKNDHA